jgi:hypothetical protein
MAQSGGAKSHRLGDADLVQMLQQTAGIRPSPILFHRLP